METTLIGIILTAVGQFSVVHVVFATAVALNNADDDKKEDEEGESKNHADEPAGSSDTIVTMWHNHNI